MRKVNIVLLFHDKSDPLDLKLLFYPNRKWNVIPFAFPLTFSICPRTDSTTTEYDAAAVI
jgi:hypothetical protein